MPNCFRLLRDGAAVPLAQVDDEMRRAFGVPPDPAHYFEEWYNIIGFELAMGRSFDQIRSHLESAWADSPELVRIADWLEANFTVDSWYELKIIPRGSREEIRAVGAVLAVPRSPVTSGISACLAYLAGGFASLGVAVVRSRRRRDGRDWGEIALASLLWPVLVVAWVHRRAEARRRLPDPPPLVPSPAPVLEVVGRRPGLSAEEERDPQDRRDELVVVDYFQDPDSFGWSVAALLRAAHKPGGPRWGTLDALCGTHDGASSKEPTDLRDAVRRMWHLVDWHGSEANARAAFADLSSRRW